jgi:LPXTG-motif cell wall-anchored protein
MIEEHGDQLFVVFGFICLGVIVWIFGRRRKHPVRDISVVVLPLGNTPRHEPETDPPPFSDRPGL